MGCIELLLFPLVFFVVQPERIFLAAVFLCLVFLLFHWMQRRAWPVLGAAAVLQHGRPGVAPCGALAAAHQQGLDGAQSGGEGRDGGGADGRGLHGDGLPRCRAGNGGVR